MLHRLQETVEAAGAGGSKKSLVETPVITRVKTADRVLALLSKQPRLTLAEIAAHLSQPTRAIAALPMCLMPASLSGFCITSHRSNASCMRSQL
jgi:hypothetical protein